jgi:hypothetical protein
MGVMSTIFGAGLPGQIEPFQAMPSIFCATPLEIVASHERLNLAVIVC